MPWSKFLRLFFVFNFLAAAAWAAEEDHTWSLSGSLAAGTSGNEIFIGVTNQTDISSFAIEVHFDTTLLEFEEYESSSDYLVGRAESVSPPSIMEFTGFVRMVLFAFTGSIVPGSGDVYKLSFKVKEGVEPGTQVTLQLTRKDSAVVLATQQFTVEERILPVEINSPQEGAAFEVKEGELLEIVFSITNQGDSLSSSGLNLPAGAELVADTILQWRPGQAAAGTYPLSVIFSNETGAADTVDLTINVEAANSPPVWPVDQDTLFTLREGETFSHVFQPPVDEDPGDIVLYSILNNPQGSEFNSLTLSFTWTPGFDDAGVYQFVLQGTDLQGARGSKLVTLVVENVGQPPQLISAADTVTGKEGELLSFTLGAYDPDGQRVVVTAENLPAGASFMDPVFSWPEPTEGQYTVIFVATDPDSLKDSTAVTIVVQGVNHPPVFAAVPDTSVDAGTALEITLSATDPDGDPVTFALVVTGADNILTRGASFVGNVFNWTPQAGDIGPNIVTFLAQDPEGLTDRITVTITVIGRNITPPPEFAAFQDQEIEEGQEFVFDLPLVDPALEGLRFWAINLPTGALLDSTTGRFTWTPGLTQSGTYQVTFGVSDGSFQDIEVLTIKVKEKDVPPVLASVGDKTVNENELLKFNLQAVDESGETFTFDADGLPAGASVFPQGLFKFRPGFDQAGSYSITFVVTDASGNTDEETITLTVLDVNRRPELVVSNQQVSENVKLSFTVTATDPDNDPLSFAADSLPAGASFDPATRVFDWTPNQEQSGNYRVLFTASDGKDNGTDSAWVVISVGDVNRPPVVDPVGDQIVAEGESLSFQIIASDPDSEDQVTLKISGLPEGYQVSSSGTNPVTVTVQLSPGYRQEGLYQVSVTASDDDLQNPLSVTSRFNLEVLDTDVAPSFKGALAGPGDLEVSVAEGGLLEIVVEAEDLGGDALSYSVTGLPRNATADFTSSQKKIIFTPDFTQAGVTQFEVIASDGGQSVSKTVKVTVVDVNQMPRVDQIEDQSVQEGDVITFEVTAFDPDGDSVTVFTAGRVPFLTAGDNPPAYIRDGNVFVFDTEPLPKDQQIESAVFVFWAEDTRGGTSDTVQVEIAVVRSDSTQISDLAGGGDSTTIDPAGLGLDGKIVNNGTTTLSGTIRFSEKSGFPDQVFVPTLLASADTPVKSSRKGVYTFLAGDLVSQFYGMRRGWGLDLTGIQNPTTQQLPTGVEVTVTLRYFDEDLPTEIPNFTEKWLSVFGYDALQGTWVQIQGAVLDTINNTATFLASDTKITDYTIGAVLDVVAPLITDLQVSAGNFRVSSSGVDTLYDLGGQYELRVNITDDEIVSPTNAKLYYAVGEGEFKELQLNRASGNLYTATIQEGALASGTVIRYYVAAQDSMNLVTLPPGAPADFYELVLLEYTLQPGDVDGSGVINIFDLLSLLKVLGGSQPASIGSDVNGSGKTDIFDLLALLKILAGS